MMVPRAEVGAELAFDNQSVAPAVEAAVAPGSGDGDRVLEPMAVAHHSVPAGSTGEGRRYPLARLYPTDSLVGLVIAARNEIEHAMDNDEDTQAQQIHLETAHEEPK